ncbi:DsbA family protein [Bacillus sp. es.036]|uniref:DsbA family protein n=1 Tax=Bacillus sp. es.036 TaxID=1761764 RepID=UPI000BF35FD4|nr:thioredoxin domain-containing protein [Bacillus sp. es.036]PFG02910.1 thioredoxin-like protein [Bacillus sp. es.036]
MAKPKKKLKRSARWFFLIVGIVLVLLVISMRFKPFADTKGFQLENQPFLGEETAPVELVAFGDYRCPSCQSFNHSFLPLIQEELIATGKVKFYFVQHPFVGEDSTKAAEFAEVVYQELGNDVFWQFHHVVYDELQVDKNKPTLSFLTETLSGLVSEEETDKVVAAYKGGAGEKAVEADLAYANKQNVSATSALLVDGKRFEGNSLSELNNMVENSTSE